MNYKLIKTIEFAGEKKESVEIKEKWNAGDFIEIQNAGSREGDRCCRQVAIAIDWPDPQVRELGMEDFMNILTKTNTFFPQTAATKKDS